MRRGRFWRAPERTQDRPDEITTAEINAAAEALQQGSAATMLARDDYWHRQAERALRAARLERRR